MFEAFKTALWTAVFNATEVAIPEALVVTIISGITAEEVKKAFVRNLKSSVIVNGWDLLSVRVRLEKFLGPWHRTHYERYKNSHYHPCSV